jgi:cell division protein FtsI (penicillin-binding protein 3)
MRLVVLFGLAAAALVAGAGRLAYINYEQGEEWSARAAEQHTRRLEIPAQRGSILDAQGRTLAGSVRNQSVFMDCTLITDPAYAAYSIAPALNMEPAALLKLIQERKNEQFVWVKRNITREELEAFRAIREARRLSRPFQVQDEVARVYPQGTLAAHVLGYFADGKPAAGIEQKFDAELRGTPGSRVVIVSEDANRLASQDDAYVPPMDGHSVVLTIDSHIQRVTEQHLRKAVEEHKATWGAAMVMDPRSGEVLAMASVPDFDPARPIPPEFEGKPEGRERLRNRAIQFTYEPGSIFKPFIAAQALQEKRTSLDEIFQINGPSHAFGRRIINDTHAYASLPMYRVISQSSNIGMAMIGMRVGNAKLYEYVTNLGFGRKTGIELPGEEAGQLHPLSRWTGYSTQSIPIGQEIAVTGAQLLAAFCALSNDGVLYRPRLVRGVIAADGRTVQDFSVPDPERDVKRILDPEVAREFRMRALVETVKTGTGEKAAIPDYQVFGKTGTAQVAVEGRRGYATDRRYVGSFLGGAPASEPRAVCLVSLYHPKGKSYYGGTVAAPVVGAILADTLAYMRVPPEVSPEVVKQE